jgi:hypothetical protein
MTICTSSFNGLGRAQAKALGHPELPIAVIPHPFGFRSRAEVHDIATRCVDDINQLLCEAVSSSAPAVVSAVERATLVEAPADFDEFYDFALARRWSDGLPLVPPTAERVERMLRHTRRAPDDVVASIAPAYGAATVERIAINAVMAGCAPELLPVLIAAVEAIVVPKFNLQSVQATTNPAAVWIIVNGPIAEKLGINGGGNCLGSGSRANATLGRAMRLIQQNIGGAYPRETDHATHGQPGKYTFCCAENEAVSPWEPLSVERGYAPDASTVTVVAALGTWSMNTHAKDTDDLLRIIADTMTFPAGSDFVHTGGEPWLILAPEHAQVLKRDGLSKIDVKRRLWEQARLAGSRLSAKDFARTQDARRAELGQIGSDTLLSISLRPEDIGVIVAGGVGAHSTYVPNCGNSRSVTCEIKP